MFQRILQIEIGLHLKNHLFQEAKNYNPHITTVSGMILKFLRITSETCIQQIVDDRYGSLFEKYKNLVLSTSFKKLEIFKALNQKTPAEKEDLIINNLNSSDRMVYLCIYR